MTSLSFNIFLAECRLQFDADPTARASFQAIIERWASESLGTEPQWLDAIAEHLASGYSARELGFGFCSVLMRRLKDYSAQGAWPTLFWDIFIAFDAGEFYHEASEPRHVEPSELHTRPMIDAILCGLESTPARGD